MNRKQKSVFKQTLFILIILSLIYIGYTVSRDFLLTPAELFETAQKAENGGFYKKAEHFYLAAAASENTDTAKLAAYYLGRLYKRGGKSFPVNGRRAEIFLEQAALQNLPAAQYELALLYDVGDKIPENREKAVMWMNAAAQNNLPDALYGLGVWVERGYLGKPDMEKVITLYEKAAAEGQVQAMTSLAALYGGGFQNVPQNRERAFFWLNRLNEKNKILNAGNSGNQQTDKEKK